MATVAARSFMLSAATSVRIAACLRSAAVKPTAASQFRASSLSQKPLSARIFRLPVEMSCVSVVSMLPYHTATASAVLTSMLSVSPRSLAWSLKGGSAVEDINHPRNKVLELFLLGVHRSGGVPSRRNFFFPFRRQLSQDCMSFCQPNKFSLGRRRCRGPKRADYFVVHVVMLRLPESEFILF